MAVPTILLVTFSATSFFLAIAGVVVSELAVRNARNRQRHDNPYCGHSIIGTDWFYCRWPRDFHLENKEAVLGASITVLVLAFFILLIAMIGRTKSGLRKAGDSGVRYSQIVGSALCFLASLIAEIYTQVSFRNSTTLPTDFDAPPSGTSFREGALGWQGSFSLRSWSCQMSRILTAEEEFKQEYDETCALTTAAIWIVVPLLIFTALMLAASMWAERQDRKARRQPVAKENKQGLEMSE